MDGSVSIKCINGFIQKTNKNLFIFCPFEAHDPLKIQPKNVRKSELIENGQLGSCRF